MAHNGESYRKGMKMMDTKVQLRQRPGWWWMRSLTGGSKVMVIPIIDGVPIIHKFEIVEKEEIWHDPQEQAGRAS